MNESTLKTVGKGTLWISLGNVLLKFVSLLTIFLILTKLSIYEYGLVEIVLSIVPAFSLFLLPGLVTTVIADMGVEKGRGNKGAMKAIFFNYFYIQMIFGALAWAILFFGADIVARYYDGIGPQLIKIVSFSFFISPLRQMVAVLLSVYLKFFNQSLYSVLEEVAKLAILLVSFYVFHLYVPGVVIASIGAALVSVLIMLPVALRAYRDFGRSVVEQKLPLFHFLKSHGAWGILGASAGSLTQSSRLWLVKLFLGTEAVGLIAVAQGLFGHVVSLFPLNRVVAPMFSQFLIEKKSFIKLLNKSIKYQLAGFVIAAVGSAVVVPVLIFLFIPKYESSLLLFYILLPMVIPTSVDSIVASVFYALKAQKDLFFASLYKLALTLILIPVGGYYFGLEGVACVLVLITTLYAFERYSRLHRLLPIFTISPKEFFTVDETDSLILEKAKTVVPRFIRFLFEGKHAL